MLVKRRLLKVFFILENRKSHVEPLCLAIITNMEAGVSLQFDFFHEIHEKAMKCKQTHYRDAKTMNLFRTNPDVFFGLLQANGVQHVGNTPYCSFDFVGKIYDALCHSNLRKL